jgi:hypothetical protein
LAAALAGCAPEAGALMVVVAICARRVCSSPLQGPTYATAMPAHAATHLPARVTPADVHTGASSAALQLLQALLGSRQLAMGARGTVAAGGACSTAGGRGGDGRGGSGDGQGCNRGRGRGCGGRGGGLEAASRGGSCCGGLGCCCAVAEPLAAAPPSTAGLLGSGRAGGGRRGGGQALGPLRQLPAAATAACLHCAWHALG